MTNLAFWQAGPRFTPGRPLELKMGARAMLLNDRPSSQANTLTQEHHARLQAAGHLSSCMQSNHKSLLHGIDVFHNLTNNFVQPYQRHVAFDQSPNLNPMIHSTPFHRIGSRSPVPRSIDLAESNPPPKIYLFSLTSAYPSLPESLTTLFETSYQPMSANVTSNDTIKGG